MATVFDGNALTITLDTPTAGVLDLDVARLYSEWKEWQTAAFQNMGYPPAFRTVGGDALSATLSAGAYFFLRNDYGWRIKTTEADQTVYITGNLAPQDATLPTVIETTGAFTVAYIGLQPVTQGLPLLEEVHGQVRRSIYINTEALTNGNGYQQTPFNNWTDGIDAAEATGLQTLYLEADATVDRQIKNFEIFGIDLPQIDLNNQDMNGTVLRLCAVTGQQGDGGSRIIMFDCQMLNVTDFNGAGSLIGAVGTIGFRNGGSSILNQLVPFTAAPVTLDLTLGGAATTVEANNVSGDYIITNMDNAGDILHLAMDHGKVTIAASCTAGTIVLTGSAAITDNSAGTTVDTSGMVDEVVKNTNIEATFSLQDVLRLLGAIAAGDITQQPDGSYTIKGLDDSTNRILGDLAANNGRDITGRNVA